MIRTVRLSAIAALAGLLAAGCGTQTTKPVPPPAPPAPSASQPIPAEKQEDVVDLKATLSILQDSKDPAQLEAAAISLCKAKAAEALRNLVPILRDAKFLQRLDSEEEYKYYEHLLRIGRILVAMGRSPSSQAVEALEELSQDKAFIGNMARLDYLIKACGYLEKPSPKLLAFLDAQAQPDNAETTLVMAALARIGSPETCQLIEKRLVSKDYSQSFKETCFIHDLIQFRNKPGVVGLYKKCLKNDALDPKLREIEVLTCFDYRPREWYVPDGTPPPPPPRSEAPTEVLTEVLECADLALKLNVPQEVKDRVKVEQKEIAGILAARKACYGDGPPGKGGPVKLKAALSILRDSQEPAQLEVAAVSLCRAEAPEALRGLVPILRDDKFLKQLDPLENYGYGGPQFRYWCILDALGKSPSSQAVQALEELTETKDCAHILARQLAVIHACGVLAKSSPKLLAFLNSQAGPHDIATDDAMEALARIGSAEAWQLIEEKISSKDFADYPATKQRWLTHYLLPARNKPGGVALYKRLLRNEVLDPKLRELAVLTLFDYRRLEWYGPLGRGPEPPPRREASTEVLTEVLECADLALKLDVPQEVKERVKVARKEIEDILAGRKERKERKGP